jgi:hypothetical protein
MEDGGGDDDEEDDITGDGNCCYLLLPRRRCRPQKNEAAEVSFCLVVKPAAPFQATVFNRFQLCRIE